MKKENTEKFVEKMQLQLDILDTKHGIKGGKISSEGDLFSLTFNGKEVQKEKHWRTERFLFAMQTALDLKSPKSVEAPKPAASAPKPAPAKVVKKAVPAKVVVKKIAPKPAPKHQPASAAELAV
jgi:hypothetical protein